MTRLHRTGLESQRARQLWWPILGIWEYVVFCYVLFINSTVKTGYKQSVEQVPDISGLAKKRFTWAQQSQLGSDDIGEINMEWDELPSEQIAQEVMTLLIRQCMQILSYPILSSLHMITFVQITCQSQD
jgi:hypothetical protein